MPPGLLRRPPNGPPELPDCRIPELPNCRIPELPNCPKVPPLVYHGFTAEGDQTAIVINFPTELYDYEQPDEYRLPYDDPSVPYDWRIRHR